MAASSNDPDDELSHLDRDTFLDTVINDMITNTYFPPLSSSEQLEDDIVPEEIFEPEEDNSDDDEHVHFLGLQPIIPIEYMDLPQEEIISLLKVRPHEDFFKYGVIFYEFFYNSTKKRWSSKMPIFEVVYLRPLIKSGTPSKVDREIYDKETKQYKTISKDDLSYETWIDKPFYDLQENNFIIFENGTFNPSTQQLIRRAPSILTPYPKRNYWEQYRHVYLSNFKYFFDRIKKDFLKIFFDKIRFALRERENEMKQIKKILKKDRKEKKETKKELERKKKILRILSVKINNLRERIDHMQNELSQSRHRQDIEALEKFTDDLQSLVVELNNYLITFKDVELKKEEFEDVYDAMLQAYGQNKETAKELKSEILELKESFSKTEERNFSFFMNTFIFKRSFNYNELTQYVNNKISYFMEEITEKNEQFRTIFWNADIWLTPFNEFMTKHSQHSFAFHYTGSREFHHFFHPVWNTLPHFDLAQE